MRRTLVAGVAAVTVATLLAACGGGGSAPTSAGGGGGSNAGKPIKLGVLTSLSGPFASGFTTTEQGVKARLALENAGGGVDGHKLEYVMGDDGGGAATAVSKLVQQQKVYGILSISPSLYQGAAVAARSGVPVLGAGFDGSPQWLDPKVKNFFSLVGAVGYSAVGTTFGTFFKSQGVTKLAVVGNTNGASSAGSAIGAELSAQHAGIAKGFVDTTLPAGSTDIGPIILGIKKSGSDGLYMPVVPSTAFAVIAGLAQAGVKLKSVVLATGYGNDLLEQPPAVAAAQGVDFITPAAPVELNTPATQRFQSALKQYAGVSGTPTFAEYEGWLAADAFIAGLKLAGGGASSQEYIAKVRDLKWDTSGMMGTSGNHVLDFSHYGAVGSAGDGPASCSFIVQLKGKTFVPISSASPVCGTVIPGLKTGY